MHHLIDLWLQTVRLPAWVILNVFLATYIPRGTWRVAGEARGGLIIVTGLTLMTWGALLRTLEERGHPLGSWPDGCIAAAWTLISAGAAWLAWRRLRVLVARRHRDDPYISD